MMAAVPGNWQVGYGPAWGEAMPPQRRCNTSMLCLARLRALRVSCRGQRPGMELPTRPGNASYWGCLLPSQAVREHFNMASDRCVSLDGIAKAIAKAAGKEGTLKIVHYDPKKHKDFKFPFRRAGRRGQGARQGEERRGGRRAGRRCPGLTEHVAVGNASWPTSSPTAGSPPSPPRRAVHFFSSTDKAKRLLGWRPRHDFLSDVPALVRGGCTPCSCRDPVLPCSCAPVPPPRSLITSQPQHPPMPCISPAGARLHGLGPRHQGGGLFGRRRAAGGAGRAGGPRLVWRTGKLRAASVACRNTHGT